MLHIFLSGFRQAYRVAVLNAVCSPIGLSQTFTFTLGKNISPETVQLIGSLKTGDHALLSFVDRYSTDGYRYTAVRRAEFISAVVESSKVEIRLRLGEWPKTRVNDFNRWVTENLVPVGAPKLTGTPENENDGFYVVWSDNPPSAAFEIGDGWLGLVESLNETKALGTSDKQTVIFARLDVLENQVNTAAEWSRPSRLASMFTAPSFPSSPTLLLKRTSYYRVRIDYFFPMQQKNISAEVPYLLTLSPGLEPTTSLTGSAAALKRAEEFGFKIVSLSQRSRELLRLQFGPAPSGYPDLLAPRFDIPIEPRFSLLLLCLLVAVGALWVIGSGWFTQASFGTGEFRWGFYVGPLIQYVAVLAMFRLFGTKLT